MLTPKLFFFFLSLILLLPANAPAKVLRNYIQNCNIISPRQIAFINAGDSLEFIGSAQFISKSTDSSKISYNWKFDEYGAEPSIATGQNSGQIKFKWGGSYQVSLIVKSADNPTESCVVQRNVLVYDLKDPHEFCEGYADIASKQNQDNLTNLCGYSGELWHNDELKHQQWCESIAPDQARNELKKKAEKLRNCEKKITNNNNTTNNKHHLGDITRITDYPQSAKNIRGVPCGTDQVFIYSLFQSILEREPDSYEISEHLRNLHRGMSRKDMVISFFKLREYLNNNKKAQEAYKDAIQAVLGRNPRSEEIDTFPRTYPYLMAKGLFATNEYRNLCRDNKTAAPPEKRAAYNPLNDTGMAIPEQKKAAEKINALVKKFHTQQYQNTNKENDPKKDTALEQPPDYSEKVIGNSLVKTNKDMGEKFPNQCSGNYQKAYTQYMYAYNKLTALMARGKGDTPEAQTAYKNFKFFKDCLNLILVPPPPADNNQGDNDYLNHSTSVALKCANNQTEAYQLYLPVYNHLTQIMAQGHGDTPEAQRIYKNYKFYKDCYERLLNKSH